MNISRILTAFACSLLTLVPAAAQLTLDECQDLARENYPLLKKYGLIEQSTEYTVKNINKGWFPQLVFNAQATYQSDVATLPGVLVNLLENNGYDVKGLDKDQYRIALELSQNLWDGGNMKAQKELAQAQGMAQAAQTDVDMYAVCDRVNNLFFGILLLNEKIELNEDLQVLLLSNCDKLENMRKNGTAMTADVNSLKAEYLAAQQQREELESSKESFRLMLSIFTGLSKDEITDLQKPDGQMPASYENNRPELALFDAQLSQFDAQQKLINSGIKPRFSLFATGFYGYTGYDMFNDMFDHDFTLNGMVGVRLTWNISKFYTHRKDRQKLDVARLQVENAREVFLFNNSLQVAQEDEGIVKYRALIEDDEEIIALRTSVRESAEAKLEHGTIDVNTLLQEITRENQARIAKSSHETELLKTIYELRHTVNQ